MANNWRKKAIPMGEHPALRDAFGDLQLMGGGSLDLAMFFTGKISDPTIEIYITGPGIEAIEARSPGGWEDAGPPSGDNVTLLVGNGDPWSRFGIEKSF